MVNVAKMPASTIQLCGAEKALFRALKKKHDTPKYGLIYHSSLVGRATSKVKGRVCSAYYYEKPIASFCINIKIFKDT